MKGSSTNQNINQNKQLDNNKPRPEIRDNLDHRENLEINDQPTGHNSKEVKSARKSTGKSKD